MELSEYQIELMKHTVSGSNRNWFGTGYGNKDSNEFEKLVSEGYAIKQTAPSWSGDKEYMRLAKARYREKNREKHLAHKTVQAAIARGKLTRGCCEVCGKEDAHAHHDDYSKRMNIRWLCKKHHEAYHALKN